MAVKLTCADVGGSPQRQHRCPAIYAAQSRDKRLVGTGHAICCSLQCKRHPRIDRRPECVNLALHSNLPHGRRIQGRCNHNGQHHCLARVLQCNGLPSRRLTYDLVLRSRPWPTVLPRSQHGTHDFFPYSFDGVLLTWIRLTNAPPFRSSPFSP
jgi:hypothetical protein